MLSLIEHFSLDLTSRMFDIEDGRDSPFDFEHPIRGTSCGRAQVNSQSISVRKSFALFNVLPECLVINFGVERGSSVIEVPS